MKFLFLGKSFEEASTRYRIKPVAGRLEAIGHEATFASTDMSILARIKCLANVGQYDLVFIQRKLFPTWFLAILRRRVKRLVFDFDDAIFVKSSGAASSNRQRKFAAVCGAADLVLAGNAYLADAAKPYARQVDIVPTSVPTDRYQSGLRQSELRQSELRESELCESELRQSELDQTSARHERPTLVWIGSSSTRRYLDLLTPVLDQLAAMYPDLQLKVIADFELSLESMTTVNIPWTEAGEVAALGACHIGIAPMANNAWTRGKCALKVIQYMAVGLPVISDRCGANQEVIAEGETGFLADNEQDWIDAVSTLLSDQALRKSMGQAGRLRAEKLFDLNSSAEKLAQRLVEL